MCNQRTRGTNAITEVPIRQLEDQELNIIDSVKPMIQYAAIVTNSSEIRYHLVKTFYLATKGRVGSVWLDIPLDIQAAIVETYVNENMEYEFTRDKALQLNQDTEESLRRQGLSDMVCFTTDTLY